MLAATGTAQRDALLALMGSVYDASLEPTYWPHVIAQTASLLRSPRAIILTPFHKPDEGGMYFPHGFPEGAIERYARSYIQHDIWAQRGKERGLYVEGKVVLDRELVTRREMLDSVFYREYLSRIDILHLCSAIVFGENSSIPMLTNLACYRGARQPEFEEEDRDLMRVIVPHVSRALGIQVRLRDAELRSALTLVALDRLACGVVLLDSSGKLLHRNRRAEQIIDANDGLRIDRRPEGAVLATLHASETRALHAAIAVALHPQTIRVPHFSRGVRASRRSGKAAYVLNVAPLPPGNAFGEGHDRPHVIVFIIDPQAPPVFDAALLNRLYGLTLAEVRVAERVCAGDTIAQAAEVLGVAESTVRTQLNSVFAKTATRRQSELVRLLTSIGSVQSGAPPHDPSTPGADAEKV